MTDIKSEAGAEIRLSGRELARQRRKAMAQQGKRAVKTERLKISASGQSLKASSNQSLSEWHSQSESAVPPLSSGRAKARKRREAMARSGKAELSASNTRRRVALEKRTASAETPKTDGRCGCGCKPGQQNSEGPSRAFARMDVPQSETVDRSAAVGPRELAERLVKNHAHRTGRDVALARRKALSQEGKAGLKKAAQATKIAKYLPEKDWRIAITRGVTGRQIAMQRRKVRSLTGQGEEKTNPVNSERRSAGRRSARAVANAPPKVLENHTLSGSEVTGTSIERSQQVTGNETGGCRSITGTEYIGVEQYATFCDTQPDEHPPKVTISRTLRGKTVSGADVSQDKKVTGNEYGACRDVTGTQYLSSEHFDRCNVRPSVSSQKTEVTHTRGKQSLTGMASPSKERVTGNEAGSSRDISGTQYTNSRSGIGNNAPEKVAVTHTAEGNSVTGTSVGNSARITGVENGLCRVVSGSEYLSAEQYSEFCDSPAPHHPHKVSVMSTPNRQPITGAAVSRDMKVTGGETGSCRSVTGTPYFNSQDFGDACAAEYPEKVGDAYTREGTRVSGTEVNTSPKMSGDEDGRCALVTGTDYAGAQDLNAVCGPGTPVTHNPEKVSVDSTWQGEPVTGTAVGHSPKITGDERGSCAPVSGDGYIGQRQYAEFCEPDDIKAQQARVATHGVVSAAAVTGDRPGAGGSVMTGDERGACAPISGTNYLGADNIAPECITDNIGSGRYVSSRSIAEEMSANAGELNPGGFSVPSPARDALERQKNSAVTGAQVGGERITGSVNRAQGIVTGTPEFRHRGAIEYSAPVMREQTDDRQRLTGEARQISQITGDSWHDQQRVTGTEGHFATARNMTQRGNPRGVIRSAREYKDLERPDVPDSPITGSAGISKKGAVVTVSGGARG